MRTDFTIKRQSNPWLLTSISSSASSKKAKKYSSKKAIPSWPINSVQMTIFSTGEQPLNTGWIREDSMSNSKHLIKSEKETSLQCIWSKNMRTRTDMLSRPSLKKLLTVKKKGRNVWLRKLKSWDIWLIQIIWDFSKYLSQKIHFTLSLSC